MNKPNFQTKPVELTESYGQFILEPLPASFGYSIGNALRRSLMSSLKGAAITSVKINGAAHLFTTIKGVKESSMEIVMNLKGLKFKTSGEGPFKVTISKKATGKIYGKDIEGEAEVVNKDHYIAELTDDKTRLEIEAIVETGYGYLSADEREKKEYGHIAVDAFFSPIKKVNFKVEEARVGRKSNYDKLILDIWTDGSTKPEQAIKEVAGILSNFFGYILSGQDKPQEKIEGVVSPEENKEAIDKKYSEIIIDELNLPSRVINALLRESIETVADLIKAGRQRLTTMKGVGKKSIELIEEELKKMNIELV